MAPTLTSNSFHLTTPYPPRLSSLRSHRLAVFAKKPNNDDNSEPAASGIQNPFRNFDFGKVPDAKSLIPAMISNPAAGLSFGNQRRKDPGTVFVAGATGQVGVRIARTLLRDGFSVRAGVAELDAAQELARLAAAYKSISDSTLSIQIISNEESKRLNAVESTFTSAESIAKAIGNASKVVVTIGPYENGPQSEVSTLDAWQVVQAAQLAGVGHVAIVYDGGSAAGGASTNNVLDGFKMFFKNLFPQSQLLSVPEFLQKVIETDVSYTFINTSLAEDYSPESSYNVVVSTEGSSGPDDYKVAKAKIATLVADVFANTSIAENKVVDVFTNPSAPLRSVDELFSAIPEDGRRKAYADAIQKAKAEEEAKSAAEKAQEAALTAKKLEQEVKKLSEQEAKATSLADEAQKKAEAAGVSVGDMVEKAKGFGSSAAAGFSWEKLSSQLTTAVQNAGAEIPKVQVATVRGQAKARSLPVQKAVVKPPPVLKSKPKKAVQPEAVVAEEKKEVRKLFGGLFKQETIYIDDD
ncbi:Protein PLASTID TRANSCRIPTIONALLY ACTIVE 16, chloroplastic [Linum grandiflorum]